MSSENYLYNKPYSLKYISKNRDKVRLLNRNKKMNKHPKAYSTFNKQLEEDSMCPTMILTGKSQHILFNQVLEYTAVL